MAKLLDEAIELATRAHEGQVRKLKDTPYILHPMEVAVIVSTLTSDEEILAAAVLHDTVEDTYVTIEEIYENFGYRVGALVSSETENKRTDIPPAETWKIRKEESLAEMKANKDPAVKMLWLGDKLSNLRSMYQIWLDRGDKVFSYFHQKDKAEHAWYYRTVMENVEELSNTAAYKEYTQLYKVIFGGVNNG